MLRESDRHLRAAQRTVSGARLATLSVAAGTFATAASLMAVAYVAAAGSREAGPDRDAIRLASHPTPTRAERLPLGAESPALAVHETQIGGVALVDVGADVVSLDDELAHQRAVAADRQERLVVWLVVSDCRPCNAVEAALPTEEVQRALARTRLVRLDAADFLSELSRLGVPMDSFPSFVLLGRDGRPRDYVDGGEWEDDVPRNIAPVLKSFVEGTYERRRTPWRGGLHEDETTI